MNATEASRRDSLVDACMRPADRKDHGLGIWSSDGLDPEALAVYSDWLEDWGYEDHARLVRLMAGMRWLCVKNGRGEGLAMPRVEYRFGVVVDVVTREAAGCGWVKEMVVPTVAFSLATVGRYPLGAKRIRPYLGNPTSNEWIWSLEHDCMGSRDEPSKVEAMRAAVRALLEHTTQPGTGREAGCVCGRVAEVERGVMEAKR